MRRTADALPPRLALLRDLTVVVVLALASAVPSSAQNVTEPSLKAAFIINIARFAAWPAEMLPDAAPLTACVVGDTPVGRELERQVRGKLVMGHSVVVTSVATDPSLRACHLLYLDAMPPGRIQQMLAAARDRSILTIVDIEAESHPGGVAHIFVENGKVRFNIDQKLAKQSRLQLSSKLLDLAKRVYDQPSAGTP